MKCVYMYEREGKKRERVNESENEREREERGCEKKKERTIGKSQSLF